MTMSYRQGAVADIPDVDRIFRASFCDTFAHLYSAENLAAFLAKFTPEAWRGEVEDPAYAFRIADVGGKAVGYVKLGPSNLPIDSDGPAMELRQLYLLREHHGVGIAQELMDWAIDEARRRGARELYLTVYIDNHRAKRVYERFGFVEVGQYDFMVGDQADHDIIMKKDL